MKTVTLDEVDTRLNEHLLQLADGEELTITVNGVPYARLTKLDRTSWPARAGTAKHPDNWMAPNFNAPIDEDAGVSKAGCYRKDGFWMAPDFDAPLDDFKEYAG